MVGHEAIAQATPTAALRDTSEEDEIRRSVSVVDPDLPAVVAAGEDVLNGARDVLARLSRHTRRRRRPGALAPSRGQTPYSNNTEGVRPL